jgi:organic hydroperoxide reductase OsmC/OhrA
VAHDHIYRTELHWSAEGGEGTKTYRGFSRTHRITAKDKEGRDKPAIVATSAFHSREHYNPDELLIGSLSSCHMLWFLAIARERRLRVKSYEDSAVGYLDGTRITRVELRPEVSFESDPGAEVLAELHHSAHERCFLAASVNCPVEVVTR